MLNESKTILCVPLTYSNSTVWYKSSHFILLSSWFLWEVRCIFFENLKRVKNRRKSSSAGDWPTDESLVRILPKFDDIRRSLARVANPLFPINSSLVSRLTTIVRNKTSLLQKHNKNQPTLVHHFGISKCYLVLLNNPTSIPRWIRNEIWSKNLWNKIAGIFEN